MQEIETHYSLNDVMIANEALDIKDELEALQSEELKNEMNNL